MWGDKSECVHGVSMAPCLEGSRNRAVPGGQQVVLAVL